jgi:hypothetical protein
VVCPVPVIEKLEEVMENAPVMDLMVRNKASGVEVEIIHCYYKLSIE